MNVSPPAVIVPVRGAVAVFAATVKLMVPEPVPLAPAVIEIHAAPLIAVHVQPALAVIATVPVPPVAATDWVSGAMAYVQGAAA